MTALAGAVPGFADTVQWRGETVPLHRKAIGLAADLLARFGPEDARFAFADAADLPADSGAPAGICDDILMVSSGRKLSHACNVVVPRAGQAQSPC